MKPTIDNIVESIYLSLSGSMPNGYIAPLVMVLLAVVIILIVKDIMRYISRRGNLFYLLLVIGGMGYFIYLYYRR